MVLTIDNWLAIAGIAISVGCAAGQVLLQRALERRDRSTSPYTSKSKFSQFISESVFYAIPVLNLGWQLWPRVTSLNKLVVLNICISVASLLTIYSAGLVSTRISLLRAKFDRISTQNTEQILILQLKFELADHARWIEKDVRINALSTAVEALHISVEMGTEWRIGQVLDLISRDVAALLRNDDQTIDNQLLARLLSKLKDVKGAHEIAAQTLISSAPQLIVSRSAIRSDA